MARLNKPTVRKATKAEFDKYYSESHVYPLYGFISYMGYTMAIELLSNGDEYKYEVIAPSGMIFDADGVHTLLCKNLADVRERVSDNDLAVEEQEESLRIRCNQCEALMINGLFCHETGCPNTNSRYDINSGEWIKQRKCFDCGYMCDADSECCSKDED